jgi:tRNA(fMet)-specific endonuclease VapC
MLHLLDTNACIDYLSGRFPNVVARIQAADPDALCTSAVVAAELRYAAGRSRHPRRNHLRIDALLTEIRCVPFDADAALVFGLVRSELEARGRPIGPYDMQIAAHALYLHATVVTDDVDDFARVKGLSVESWR